MKTILLIEDNTEMRENTAEILELADYHVISAENGRVGIDLAVKSHPDLIISDISMPELNGFDVLEALRKSISARRTPFIFLTAHTEKEIIKNAKDMGVDAYLTKPFEGNELLKVVSEKLTQVSNSL